MRLFTANKEIIKLPSTASSSLSFITHASQFQQGICLPFFFIDIIHQKLKSLIRGLETIIALFAVISKGSILLCMDPFVSFVSLSKQRNNSQQVKLQ